MKITGINIQVSPADNTGAPAKKSTVGGAIPNRSVGSSEFTTTSSPEPQVLTSLASTSYIKAQLETIMYSFPPFFPAGSPQRIDLIKGIRGVQDEIGKSSAPPEVKQKVAAHELTDTSSDNEVAAALGNLQQHKDVFAPKGPAQSGSDKPSVLVSLKI